MNSNNLKIIYIIFSIIFFSSSFAQVSQPNIAYSDNNVRFTIISNGVIRMEWQPSGNFVNNPSFLASERKYPQVTYKLKKGNWIEIETSKMKLRYKKNSGDFTANNIQITAAKGTKPFLWKPGMKQQNNLGGTLRTLDEMDGDLQRGSVAEAKSGEKRKLEDGLLSKDGWSFIDDSKNFIFDDSNWAWVTERKNKDGQDWYFMAYGDDYKAALKDFTVFAGKMPLPPRYAFGNWWSRYWSYSDGEFRSLIDNFHKYEIPLDVLVVDMDWHYTDEGRGGWTGWTWNKNLFPDPPKFLEYLHDNNLKVTLNLHPADGVLSYEDGFKGMSKDLELNPSTTKNIPWIGSDKKFATAFFDNILHPMEKQGVDFWWLDWQQHPYDKKVDKLSNTWWINYLFFSDKERNSTARPMLYHRWGGLGNHRYQIGFSGDTHMTWKSLDYQPYFNATASNVLYGYWSHDIGGHTGGHFSTEMYLRWLQFGALSPIMRTHTGKSADKNKEPWVFNQEVFTIIKNTIKQRYEMAPYIYTMARNAYDKGISLCYPLYYDYPQSKEAYNFKNEYMFGKDILIAPVTKESENGFAEMDVWLPDGDWYDWHTGTLLKGGKVIKRSFALDEFGIYVKAGSILPFYSDSVMNLNKNNEDYVITVFPGKEGSFSIYEDNGNDKNYENNFAVTELKSLRKGNELQISIDSRKGTYQDMPALRGYNIKLMSSVMPESVSINGKLLPFKYLQNEFAVLVQLGTLSCNEVKNINIMYPAGSVDLTDGIAGKSKRIAKVIEQLKYKDPGIVLIDELGKMGSIKEAMLYNPKNVNELVNQFNKSFSELPEILKKQKLDNERIQWFLKSIGWGKY